MAIVKYHNNMNGLAFKGFTAIDYNVFMAICCRLKDKDTEEITFTYDELKKLAGVKKNNYTAFEFTQILMGIAKKLIHMDYSEVLNNGDQTLFVLFTTFKASVNDQIFTVSVNKNAAYLLNQLTKNFTAFELEQYVSIDSKYGKRLFMLLKQFKRTGELRTKVDTFRKVLDIPDSYTNKRITEEIIKPAVSALKGYFPHLEYEAQHAARRGRPVVAYVFTFDAEKPMEHQITIPEYQKEKQKGSRQHKNSFNDFEQRQDYDMDSLEQLLLDN